MAIAHATPEVRQDFLERLAGARTQTDELFGLLRHESLYERPILERHRVVFYIGHLESFDWNLLHERALGLPAFNPAFDRLFAFGIDPVGGGLPSDQPSDWPLLSDVRGYVDQVRHRLDDALANALSSHRYVEKAGEFPLEQLLHVAIEHRLMHAETLAYMLHQLPLEKKLPRSKPPELLATRFTPTMIEIPAGVATLGMPRGAGSFGWDNEFGEEAVHVPPFAIDKYMISNRQYLEFLHGGGYERSEYWDEADWKWKSENWIAHPVFWKQSGREWLYRGMFEERPLPLDWPVYVSHAEASAYARWAGKALPTEAQWQRAAYGMVDGPERRYPWGTEPPDASRGNLDFEHWEPAPVGAYPHGESAFGVAGLLGNGWEWTSTLFGPLPGFESFAFYPGYSANFFDGKHFVMKGGSPRTAASMLRRSFRNWFQPHYQYVYAGFRCVSRDRI